MKRNVTPLQTTPTRSAAPLRVGGPAPARRGGSPRRHGRSAAKAIAARRVTAGPLSDYAMPPGLAPATAANLNPLVGALLSNSVTGPAIDCAELTAGRLSREQRELVTDLAKVLAGMAWGDLEPDTGSVLPSVSRVRGLLKIGKRRAQALHDAMRVLFCVHWQPATAGARMRG
jgi:hypothetical protein